MFSFPIGIHVLLIGLFKLGTNKQHFLTTSKQIVVFFILYQVPRELGKEKMTSFEYIYLKSTKKIVESGNVMNTAIYGSFCLVAMKTDI